MIEAIEPFVLVTLVEGLAEFINPTNLFGVIMDGLAKASLYIMIASGLTIIFGLIGILNFAHGSLTMIGSYIGGLFMVIAAGFVSGDLMLFIFFFIGALVVLAVMSALGSALELAVIRPVYDRGPATHVLLTFGLAFVLNEIVLITLDFTDIEAIVPFGNDTIPGSLDTQYQVLGVAFQGLDLFEVFFGLIVVAGVWWFLNKTRYGLYVRAATQDEEMAEALGIDVPRTFTIVFGVGVGLAGLAGMLLMWDTQGIMGEAGGAQVLLSTTVLLPAFVVVIVGGLGTFRGTVYAGILVGMVDAVMTWFFVEGVVELSWLPAVTIFLILVVVLAVRPRGLFGIEEVVEY